MLRLLFSSTGMEALLKIAVFTLLAATGGTIAWLVLSYQIRSRWPAKIPRDLQFEHELETTLKLRTLAERLPEYFKDFNSDDVVCLGPVRGNAARVLFHSGPKMTRPNHEIHRRDYILHVERLSKKRVRLRLDTNRPYSYFRIRRSEVEPLRSALEGAFGALEEV